MPANPALSVFRTALIDPTDRGVVGEWRFERNTGYDVAHAVYLGLLPDSSGYGYHGNFYGRGDAFIIGQAGPGYLFTGAGGVGVEALQVLNSWPIIGTEMSVEVLFLLNSLGPYQSIVDKNGYYYGYRLITFDDNTLAFQSGGSGATNIVSAALTSGVVYHAIGVVNTSDNPTRRLYLNGVQVASTANATALSDGANSLRFGNDSSLVYPLYGHIYFVRVYNRALSAMEVQRRYSLLAGRRERIQPDRWSGHLGKAPAAAPGTGARSFVVIAG